MTIDFIIGNWDSIPRSRRLEVLDALVKFIKDNDDVKDANELLFDILYCAREYEDDDVFGTEGLDA